MVESIYFKQFESFEKDKNSFLYNYQVLFGKDRDASERTFEKKLQFTQQESEKHDYGFIGTNRILIEQEFSQLFSVLQQKTAHSEAFRFYCYYCCLMLKQGFQTYENETKVKEYEKYLDQLKQLCESGRFPAAVANQDSFFTNLKKKIAADMADLIETPRKISKLRDRVATSNLNRIYWYFCRTTIKKSLILARDLKWLEKLGNLLGKEINVDDVVSILETPNGILRFLSVGFFAVRFIMNAGMLLKHTIAPTEKEKSLAWRKRLSNEIYKRHATFLNDIVWGTVNALTNYNELFGLTAPAAGWVVAGFMFFDVCLILWRRHLEEQEYLTKYSQYNFEKKRIKNELMTDLSIEERMFLEQHLIMLTMQIEQLELGWNTTNSTYLFNASAAILLMTGFSASMLFTPPVMILASYIVCTLAVAMYLSDGAYKNYKEKSLILKNAMLNNEGEEQSLKQYQYARDEFFFTLAKNTLAPTLFIATVAICWQVALALAIAYASFELYRFYSKNSPIKNEVIEGEEQVANIVLN